MCPLYDIIMLPPPVWWKHPAGKVFRQKGDKDFVLAAAERG